MKFTDRNGQSVSFELYNHSYINVSQAKMILTKMNITVDNSAWFIENIVKHEHNRRYKLILEIDFSKGVPVSFSPTRPIIFFLHADWLER